MLAQSNPKYWYIYVRTVHHHYINRPDRSLVRLPYLNQPKVMYCTFVIYKNAQNQGSIEDMPNTEYFNVNNL
jgi:hypothetical protein